VTDSIELSIVMPCLNEAETLARCIDKARLGIQRSGVRGEVLVADNGSKDNSVLIAENLGVRIIHVREKGYGNALRAGIQAASGKWILMGDADDSYDFSEADRFVKKFQEGFELVMGCRLPVGGGKILPGAMPWKNRWLGNPVLSFIGRFFFKCPAHDFHCGLRGFTKSAFEKMDLETTGMEFASEMVIKSTFKQLKIDEVPVTLRPDGRSRPPHLKPWRDGWRHLRFMLLFSPRWLFLAPGIFLSVIGIIFAVALSLNNIKIGGIAFDVGTLAVACMTVIIGFQLIAFAFFTKVFAVAEGLLPDDPKLSRLFKIFTLEKGILAGLFILSAGIILLACLIWIWRQTGYGELSPEKNLRRLLPAVTLIVLGIQIIFSSFFMSVLGLKTTSRKPPALPRSNL
jgi:glycosyltransferase involved in cell wall biosynthesis